MFTAVLFTVMMQAPTPTSAPSPELAQRHQAEMSRTNQLRKLAALKKAAARSVKARAEYAAAVAEQQYLDRMAPIWAAEARENARATAAVQTANAMSSMASAAQRQAAAAEAEVRIEARRAGYPQFGLRQVVP